MTSKKPSSLPSEKPNLDPSKRGSGHVHVMSTEDFDLGEDGATIFLTPTGLSIEGRITTPSLFHVFIPIDRLLEAWHQQNEEIAH